MRARTGDQRDAQTWVVLEITHAAEMKIADGTLESTLRHALDVPDNFPVFVPSCNYTTGSRTVTVHLMEGYAFVGAGLPDTKYYKLEHGPYVAQVLCTRSGYGMRTLNTIHNQKIEDLRLQLKKHATVDVTDKSHVKIVDGPYTNLGGPVLFVTEDFADVHIVLRSLDLIIRLPKVCLMLDDGTDPAETIL